MILHSLRIGLTLCCCFVVGCVQRTENEVVVYCALDQEFAAPILGGFSRAQTPLITPRPKFDVESTKTVGLVNRILAEQSRPQCDVFWNNEIMHTIRLQKAGLLVPDAFKIPATWPSDLRAKDGSWCGFSARARVLIVNQKLLPDPNDWPTSVNDLTLEKWKGKCGVARPLAGTTATHFVVLDQILGTEGARAFYDQVAANAVILSGNKQVAQSVSEGKLAWGLTDTDDAVVEKDHGLPVTMVWPDQAPGQPGTLRIPNTVGVIQGSPHPQAARLLASYLISPATEERLAMGDSAQIPIGDNVEYQPRILSDKPIRWMAADFEQAAERWETLSKAFAEQFP